MTQGSEPLHERMARSIERLRAGCRNATGAEPTIDPPPTDEQIASAAHELGRPIPEPLRELYRVADGLEAYGFGLSSTAWLGHTERDRAEHIVDWEPGGGFHQLVWGPRPQGRTLGLGCERGFLLHGHECGPAAVGLVPANPADRA